MKEVLGTCNLGFRATTGDYILLKYRSGVMVEPIVSISCPEMKSNGLSIVLDILRNPPGPDAKEMSNFDEKTKKSLLKIKRDYALITMSLLQNDFQELKIIPLHAGRGWSFERHTDEICHLQLPITNEQFLKTIRDAFEIAT